MEEEYGWGIGSTVALVIVAAILLFAPLIIGPLTAPSYSLLLLIPVVLVAVLLYLIHASN